MSLLKNTIIALRGLFAWRPTDELRNDSPIVEHGVASKSDADTETEPESITGTQTATHSRFSAVKWLGKSLIQGAIMLLVFVGGIALIGYAQRAGWIQPAEDTAPASVTNEAVRYICPMMCTPPTNQAGRCPVCAMQLVEAPEGGEGDGLSVSIEPVARRLVGIQTATAQQGAVSQIIRTIGSIDYDESKLATISAFVSGRIEQLFANYV
ncbi:MAG: heavy metal-binding domain-containing protein, partial [Planctomycetota bacterium]